jgi:hypothetical protein
MAAKPSYAQTVQEELVRVAERLAGRDPRALETTDRVAKALKSALSGYKGDSSNHYTWGQIYRTMGDVLDKEFQGVSGEWIPAISIDLFVDAPGEVHVRLRRDPWEGGLCVTTFDSLRNAPTEITL